MAKHGLPDKTAKDEVEDEGDGEEKGRADPQVSEDSQHNRLEQSQRMAGAWLTEMSLQSWDL